MNNKRPYIIQFVCIFTVLIAIMLQGFTHVVKMKPLKGFVNEEIRPVKLSFKTYYDGSFQGYLTKNAKRNTGFREFFIRNYNQVVYSCFRKITNKNIAEGVDRELYLKMYLDDVMGISLKQYYANVEDAKSSALKNVEETIQLIDTLQEHGTKFLFVFAPSKTLVYPEKMPEYYRDHISDFSLQEYYIELFKEKGIPHIDFLNYFRSLKDTTTYPLYTRTGTHWAQSTIPMVMDSIFRKMEEVSGYKLPSVKVDSLNITTEYPVMDAELEINMNLLFPYPKPALPCPVISLTDTGSESQLNLLVVGDSYADQLIYSNFVKAFHHWHYWKYNREIYSSLNYFNGKSLKTTYDADEMLKEADLVLVICTAPMCYSFMFGFAQTAQDLYQKDGASEEEKFQMTIESIKANEEWMKAIEEQAKERGITVEENLQRNARYVMEQNKKKKEKLNN